VTTSCRRCEMNTSRGFLELCENTECGVTLLLKNGEKVKGTVRGFDEIGIEIDGSDGYSYLVALEEVAYIRYSN
jgi:sRNA-binding regulator protein Hfq